MMTMVKSGLSAWLETFFLEKNLSNLNYEVVVEGNMHIIDTQFVIGLIYKASEAEKAQIKALLIQIDFRNGDVHHLMRHLAECYIKTCHSQ